MKTYATKANARRAAKAAIKDVEAPVEGMDFTIEEVEGKFGWRRVQKAADPKPEAAATFQLEPAPVSTQADPAPAEAPAEDPVPEKVVPVKEKGSKPVTGTPRRKGAVREVWDICEANKDLQRKDVINICVSQGINFYTARTQYQAWKQASDNSK